MIVRRSQAELDIMREAGRVTARALRMVGEAVGVGVSTADLDAVAEHVISDAGALPAFKGYHGFPATICASLNSVVVHGIPDRTKLREGDIISVDVGAIVEGYYGDSARTFPVGDIDPEVRRLLDATEASLDAGIRKCVPGMRLYDISSAVQRTAEAEGFAIVREYVGHGIGRSMHEEPQVPNYGTAGRGPTLQPGMVLAIEPMVNAGGAGVRQGDDGWAVFTLDGSASAHFEHTVAVTADGPAILTLE